MKINNILKNLFIILVISLPFRAYLLTLDFYKTLFFDEAAPGLMALEMLEKKFCVFYWGAPYLGSLESIVGAGLFVLFGVSATVLRLSPLIFFIVFVTATFLLAKKISANKFPIFAALYLFLPPFELTFSAIAPIGGYMHTVAIGSLIMLLTAYLLEDNLSEKRIKWLLISIGFLGGLGFWTFMMIVSYVFASYFCILIKYKKKFFSKNLIYSIIMFFAGSFPFWYWNIKNNFLTFTMRASTAEPINLNMNLTNYRDILLYHLGQTSYNYSNFFLCVLLIIVIIFLIYKFNIKKIIPALIRPNLFFYFLLIFILSSCAYIFSPHGAKLLPRYLLPLYSVLPLFLEYIFSNISQKRKSLIFIFVIFIISLNLPSNLKQLKCITDPNYKDNIVQKKENLDNLVSFLKSHNIKYAYAPFFISYSITFHAKKEILCADICGYRNIRYLEEVDKSDNAALIIHDLLTPPSPYTLSEHLKLLTNDYKMKKVGEYFVYYDFKLPDYQYVDLKGNIKSLYGNDNIENLKFIADRNVSTYWSSKDVMNGDEEIVVEMNAPCEISKLSIVPGNRIDFPRGLEIMASDDGNNWTSVKKASETVASLLRYKQYLRFFGDGQVDVYFDSPIRNKYIKIKQLCSNSFSWSISELFIYKSKEKDTSVTSELIEYMDKLSPENYLVTYPYISTSTKHINKIPMYMKELEYFDDMRIWDYDIKFRKLNFNNKITFITDNFESEQIEKYLNTNLIKYNAKDLSGFKIINSEPYDNQLEKQIAVREINNWKCFDSSINKLLDITAFINIDSTNLSLQTDLGYTVSFDGICLNNRIKLKNKENPFSNVFVSLDGKDWKQIKFRELEYLYWTDTHILNCLPDVRKYVFENKIEARYLRIIPKFSHLTLDELKWLIDLNLFNFLNFNNNSEKSEKLTDIITYKDSDKNITFDNKIELFDFSNYSKESVLNNCIHLSYKLLFHEKIKNEFSVYVHFLSEDNKILFQSDHSIDGGYFIKGEVVNKDLLIEIPKELNYKGKVKICIGIWKPSINKVLKTTSQLVKVADGHIIDEIRI